MTDTESLLLVSLGWVTGVATHFLVNYAERTRRKHNLLKAFLNEFLELQFSMIFCAFSVRNRNKSLSDDFLQKMHKILNSYNGYRSKENIQQLSTTIENILKKSPEERFSPTGEAQSHKQHSMLLLTTNISDLIICPLNCQTIITIIKHHLDIYNQSILLSRSILDKTFEIDALNHKILKSNLEKEYKTIGSQAEIIVDAVNDFIRVSKPIIQQRIQF